MDADSSGAGQGLASARSSAAQETLEFRTIHIRHSAGRFGHTFFATTLELQPYISTGHPDLGPADLGMFTGWRDLWAEQST